MMSCCFGGGSQRVDSSDSKKPVVEKIEVRPGTGQEPRNGSNEDGGGSQDGSGAQPISVANWMKSLLQSPEPRRNPETAWLKVTRVACWLLIHCLSLSAAADLVSMLLAGEYATWKRRR